jgi:hypothetical protein
MGKVMLKFDINVKGTAIAKLMSGCNNLRPTPPGFRLSPERMRETPGFRLSPEWSVREAGVMR